MRAEGEAPSEEPKSESPPIDGAALTGDDSTKRSTGVVLPKTEPASTAATSKRPDEQKEASVDNTREIEVKGKSEDQPLPDLGSSVVGAAQGLIDLFEGFIHQNTAFIRQAYPSWFDSFDNRGEVLPLEVAYTPFQLTEDSFAWGEVVAANYSSGTSSWGLGTPKLDIVFGTAWGLVMNLAFARLLQFSTDADFLVELQNAQLPTVLLPGTWVTVFKTCGLNGAQIPVGQLTDGLGIPLTVKLDTVVSTAELTQPFFEVEGIVSTLSGILAKKFGLDPVETTPYGRSLFEPSWSLPQEFRRGLTGSNPIQQAASSLVSFFREPGLMKGNRLEFLGRLRVYIELHNTMCSLTAITGCDSVSLAELLGRTGLPTSFPFDNGFSSAGGDFLVTYSNRSSSDIQLASVICCPVRIDVPRISGFFAEYLNSICVVSIIDIESVISRSWQYQSVRTGAMTGKSCMRVLVARAGSEMGGSGSLTPVAPGDGGDTTPGNGGSAVARGAGSNGNGGGSSTRCALAGRTVKSGLTSSRSTRSPRTSGFGVAMLADSEGSTFGTFTQIVYNAINDRNFRPITDSISADAATIAALTTKIEEALNIGNKASEWLTVTARINDRECQLFEKAALIELRRSWKLGQVSRADSSTLNEYYWSLRFGESFDSSDLEGELIVVPMDMCTGKTFCAQRSLQERGPGLTDVDWLYMGELAIKVAGKQCIGRADMTPEEWAELGRNQKAVVEEAWRSGSFEKHILLAHSPLSATVGSIKCYNTIGLCMEAVTFAKHLSERARKYSNLGPKDREEKVRNLLALAFLNRFCSGGNKIRVTERERDLLLLNICKFAGKE